MLDHDFFFGVPITFQRATFANVSAHDGISAETMDVVNESTCRIAPVRSDLGVRIYCLGLWISTRSFAVRQIRDDSGSDEPIVHRLGVAFGCLDTHCQKSEQHNDSSAAR